MKQAFVYCLKVYLTGTLLAILFSGLVSYNVHRATFQSFGVSYSLFYQQFASLWEYILLGSTIVWAILVKLVQMTNNTNWTDFKKRRAIFLMVEGFNAVLIIVVYLLIRRNDVLPWMLLWLIYATTLAMSVMVYRAKIDRVSRRE